MVRFVAKYVYFNEIFPLVSKMVFHVIPGSCEFFADFAIFTILLEKKHTKSFLDTRDVAIGNATKKRPMGSVFIRATLTME